MPLWSDRYIATKRARNIRRQRTARAVLACSASACPRAERPGDSVWLGLTEVSSSGAAPSLRCGSYRWHKHVRNGLHRADSATHTTARFALAVRSSSRTPVNAHQCTQSYRGGMVPVWVHERSNVGGADIGRTTVTSAASERARGDKGLDGRGI